MELTEVKRALSNKVIFDGVTYILTGCILRRDKNTNTFFYQAELSDIRARSVRIVKLEDIQVQGGEV